MSHKNCAAAFLILLCVLFIAFFLRVGSVCIDSSVLSLLPSKTKSSVPEYILDAYTSRVDRQVVFLVKDNSESASVTYSFIDKLKSLPQTEKIISLVSCEDELNFNRFIFDNRTAFIDSASREKLKSDSYVKWVLTNIYSAFMSVGQSELDADPMLVARSVFSALSENQPFKIRNGILSVKDGEDTWYFICLITTDTGFDVKSADEFVNNITGFCANIKSTSPSTQILMRGTVFYSDYAAKTAQHDLKILGSISIIGVFILIYLMFRSLLPVFITLLAVCAGILAGLSVLFVFYDRVNLVIIGMGLSVVGVVCDYSIYYLTMYQSSLSEGSVSLIRRMSRPLLFASGTDIAAYLIILISPVEPLKQLSLFCIGAISVTVLCVILLEPYLCTYVKKRTLKKSLLIEGYLKLVSSLKVRVVIISVIFGISIYGVMTIRADDDPSSLQSMPSELKAQDQMIGALTGQTSSQKFIIIHENSKTALLELSDRLKEYLYRQKEAGFIRSYKTLPLNSPKTQTDDCRIVNEKLVILKEKLSKLDISSRTDSYANNSVSLDEFFNSFAGAHYQMLYLEDEKNSLYTMCVLVDPLMDREKLESDLLRISDRITYLDRRDDFKNVFASFRELIFYVLLTFLAVILLSGIIRLGLKKGAVSFFASLAGVLSALGSLSILDIKMNLFNELALILVLGIGINYTIFFAGNQKEKATAIRAIFTALLTTVLTVGILVFSSVSAIVGFATTLCFGITVSFVLATILPEFFNEKNS
ncbi:MAG: MMPL family transporter [Succinivibrio sp.]